MAKSLDGIKKLNPDDIKKYRKIVLNYIGENEPALTVERKDYDREASAARKVDGVNINKKNKLLIKEKEAVKKDFIQSDSANRTDRPAEAPDELKIDLVKSREQEQERMREAIERQEAERKKIKEEERQYQLQQERAEAAKRWAEKIRLAELEKAEKIKAKEKISLEQERVRQEKIKKIELEKQEREIIKQEELKKKEIAAKVKDEQEEIKRAEAAKVWAEKIRLAELEKAEQRKIKENLRLKNLKRQEEIKKVKQAAKIKKMAVREKKRLKRQKAWRKTKKKLKFKLKIFLFKAKKNFIYLAALVMLGLAGAYLIFCLIALRFNNNLIGWAADYLPVPAVITSDGLIGYLDYKTAEDNKYLNLSLAGKKNYWAKWEILWDLRKKYGLPAGAAENDLAIKYVLDKDFNQIGLSRINKISELLIEKNSLESLSKYGDEYNEGSYFNRQDLVEKFGPGVSELAVGQISNIITRADGYYLVERMADKNGQVGVKYLFVRAQTLEQYIKNKLAKAVVFILAD